MKVSPYKRGPKDLKVALITGERAYLESGYEVALDDLPLNVRAYAYSERIVHSLAKQRHGSLRLWSEDVTRAVIPIAAGRLNVILLRDDPLLAVDAESAMHTLIEIAIWVRSHGGAPGTPAYMANSLFRAGLPGERFLGKLPVPDLDVIGGRQVVRPGRVKDVMLWDLHSAYPSVLSALWVPAYYRRYRHVSLEDKAFVRADVRLPKGLIYGPLPAVDKDYPVRGVINGLWLAAELNAAKAVGARISIREGWIGAGSCQLFHRWSLIVQEGLAFDGLTRDLAKTIRMALWSTFAIHGRGSWIDFLPDGKARRWEEIQDRYPMAPAVSASVTAEVRARVYREYLYPHQEEVLTLYTDGGILPRGLEPQGPIGNEPGQWSVRARGAVAQIEGAASFRIEDYDGTVVHMSGRVRKPLRRRKRAV